MTHDPARTVEPAVLSIVDAGTYLGVSADTIRRLIKSGEIPHARIGHSVRVQRLDLEDFLKQQTSRSWRPSKTKE